MAKDPNDRVYLSQCDVTELRSLIATARELSSAAHKDSLLNEIALALTVAQQEASASKKPQQIILDVRP